LPTFDKGLTLAPGRCRKDAFRPSLPFLSSSSLSLSPGPAAGHFPKRLRSETLITFVSLMIFVSAPGDEAGADAMDLVTAGLAARPPLSTPEAAGSPATMRKPGLRALRTSPNVSDRCRPCPLRPGTVNTSQRFASQILLRRPAPVRVRIGGRDCRIAGE